jgi:hypothetical protein|tara:strand:- start:859 stop:1164 length:306 start_codon:yes stop_codon:yes gene_type:complete
MVVTDLIYRLVGRSDTTWTETVEGHPERDTLHIGFSGDEDRRETVRSILQQSGVLLSEVERLREEGVVLDVVLDDYFVGLRLSLERVWLFTSWSRETILRF